MRIGSFEVGFRHEQANWHQLGSKMSFFGAHILPTGRGKGMWYILFTEQIFWFLKLGVFFLVIDKKVIEMTNK